MSGSTSVYYPPPAFSFTVTVAGSASALQLSSGYDCGFQEVSGLDATFETEAVPEGGQNGYVHKLPKVGKYPNLVLRRGYVTKPSFLSEWAAQTVGSSLADPILTQSLVVMLLGADRVPLVAWYCAQAWPVRWVTGPFDSAKNQVLSESLEFAYAYASRIPLNEAVSMVPAVAALIGT
ncbi:MAG TPA: phage tail protein [Rhodopila sp.]|nr:phage tail protein [Rhodopila sp.]